MTALIAWLDASSEEQRRMREIVNLFMQSESRDELGIGQVRDALSDRLFPGTSTLHTRAKYLLFIPWCYLTAEQGTGSRGSVEERAARNERKLISTFKGLPPDQTVGLIGRVAGPTVKTLPSSLYHSALKRYGVLLADEVSEAAVTRAVSSAEAAEMVERAVTVWSPTLPPTPAGFPKTLEGGFALTHEEATWLREHMMAGSSGSMLHRLLGSSAALSPETSFPWEEPIVRSSSGVLGRDRDHARLFSLAMHGGSLLYNLLIAERYEQARLTRIAEPVADYRQQLVDWADRCVEEAASWAAWDIADFWRTVMATNPRVGVTTRAFVNAWLDVVRAGDFAAAAESQGLRQMIEQRERHQKGKQSRLSNDKLLRAWSGGSGTGQLSYRWSNVRSLVGDVKAGLAGAHAPA